MPITSAFTESCATNLYLTPCKGGRFRYVPGYSSKGCLIRSGKYTCVLQAVVDGWACNVLERRGYEIVVVIAE